jgi:hypothetical protein
MKTLIKVTLFLFLFFSPPVFAQDITVVNNWKFLGLAASSTDSAKISSFIEESEYQIFNSWGTTKKNGGWYIQSTWQKDFPSNPFVPDTVKLDVKYLGGKNVDYIDVGLAMEDDNFYYFYHKKRIKIDGEWCEIFWDMKNMKKLIKNFYKFQLIFLIVSQDSCYVGANIATDNLRGVDDTLGVVIYDSFGSPTAVTDLDQIPKGFVLDQNYPNPFNPSTKIRFSILEREFVNLTVFNSLGQEIQTLLSEEKNSGNYEVEFNASDLPSGIYFYKLQAGSFVETKKMLLLK